MQVRKLTLKNDRVRVVGWMRSGAPTKEGVSLYASLFPDPVFLAKLKKDPEGNREELYLTFCAMLDITYQRFEQIVNEWHAKEKHIPKRTERSNEAKQQGAGSLPSKVETKRNSSRSFRNDWPFLSRPECPPQLKALAADKISCWERYTEAHKQLFDCSSVEECYQVAYTLIENFKENRQIFEELDYYKQHKSVLGLHRIFGQFKRFDELRGKKPIELFKLYNDTLPHRIWRINSEIKKGDKPHLNGEREQRLAEVQAELAEVKRLLGVDG